MRAGALLAADLRMLHRYGVLVAAVVVMLGGLALGLLPPEMRVSFLPAALVLDTAVFGFFLMTGILFLERSDGVLPAVVVTPVSTTRLLLSKVAALTLVVLALTTALVVALIGFDVRWPLLLAGMTIGSVMTMLGGFVLASRFRGISESVLPSSAILVLVNVPALHHFGVSTSPLFYALPTMPAMVLVRGAFAPIRAWEVAYALMYGALLCALLVPWARRAFERFVTGDPPARGPRTAATAPPGPRRGRLSALVRADLKNLRRDPLLVFAVAYAALLAVVGRWLVPWVIEASAASVDLVPHVPLFVAFLTVLTCPLLFGTLAGLMLLDERDEGSLAALRVTPLPMAQYAFVRAGLPMLASAFICVFGVRVTGLIDVAWGPLLVVALVGALEVPTIALVLACFAGNKVEGLAVSKGLGVLLLAPILAWFVAPPARWLFGLVPTFWPSEVLFHANGPVAAFVGVTAVGVAIHLVALAWLLRRFRARV